MPHPGVMSNFIKNFLKDLRPTKADVELIAAIKAYPARGGSAVVVLPHASRTHQDVTR